MPKSICPAVVVFPVPIRSHPFTVVLERDAVIDPEFWVMLPVLVRVLLERVWVKSVPTISPVPTPWTPELAVSWALMSTPSTRRLVSMTMSA